MPPQRNVPTGAGVKNTKPFKPQRPAANGKGKAKASTAAIDISDDEHQDIQDDERSRDLDDLDDLDEDDSEGDDFSAFSENPKSQPSNSSSARRTTNTSTAPRRASAVDVSSRHVDDENDEAPPPIPEKLLVRLLHDGFESKDTKIGKDAMAVVSKYVETFVREAVARANFERNEGTGGRAGAPGQGFLQVEDLEKLGPQLILDF